MDPLQAVVELHAKRQALQSLRQVHTLQALVKDIGFDKREALEIGQPDSRQALAKQDPKG